MMTDYLKKQISVPSSFKASPFTAKAAPQPEVAGESTHLLVFERKSDVPIPTIRAQFVARKEPKIPLAALKIAKAHELLTDLQECIFYLDTVEPTTTTHESTLQQVLSFKDFISNFIETIKKLKKSHLNVFERNALTVLEEKLGASCASLLETERRLTTQDDPRRLKRELSQGPLPEPFHRTEPGLECEVRTSYMCTDAVRVFNVTSFEMLQDLPANSARSLRQIVRHQKVTCFMEQVQASTSYKYKNASATEFLTQIESAATEVHDAVFKSNMKLSLQIAMPGFLKSSPVKEFRQYPLTDADEAQLIELLDEYEAEEKDAQALQDLKQKLGDTDLRSPRSLKSLLLVEKDGNTFLSPNFDDSAFRALKESKILSHIKQAQLTELLSLYIAPKLMIGIAYGFRTERIYGYGVDRYDHVYMRLMESFNGDQRAIAQLLLHFVDPEKNPFPKLEKPLTDQDFLLANQVAVLMFHVEESRHQGACKQAIQLLQLVSIGRLELQDLFATPYNIRRFHRSEAAQIKYLHEKAGRLGRLFRLDPADTKKYAVVLTHVCLSMSPNNAVPSTQDEVHYLGSRTNKKELAIPAHVNDYLVDHLFTKNSKPIQPIFDTLLTRLFLLHEWDYRNLHQAIRFTMESDFSCINFTKPDFRALVLEEPAKTEDLNVEESKTKKMLTKSSSASELLQKTPGKKSARKTDSAHTLPAKDSEFETRFAKLIVLFHAYSDNLDKAIESHKEGRSKIGAPE